MGRSSDRTFVVGDPVWVGGRIEKVSQTSRGEEFTVYVNNKEIEVNRLFLAHADDFECKQEPEIPTVKKQPAKKKGGRRR